MSDTATKRPERRVYRDLRPNPDHLVPGNVTMPKPVAEANAAARQALEQYLEAGGALKAAREALAAAPKDDAAAATAAVKADDELPEPTVGAKRQAVQEAERRTAAATRIAQDAIYDLTDRIAEGREEWLAELRERRDTHTAANKELVAELRNRLAEQTAERVVLRELEPDERWSTGVLPPQRFNMPGQAQRDRRAERAGENMRKHRSTRFDRRDADQVFAALELLVEESTV